MSFRKFSKSIKANMSGIGGSGSKLNSEAVQVDANGHKDDVNDNSDNSIGPLQCQENHIFISVREPWKWVMEGVCTQNSGGLSTITRVDTARDLPTGKLAPLVAFATASNPQNKNTNRRRFQRANTAAADAKSTLRVEIVSNAIPSHRNGTGNESSNSSNNVTRPWTLDAFHCTSQAFDGLDDKDELARTLKRCRCDDLNLCPPSQLINWDVTKEECKNLVGDSLPSLFQDSTADPTRIAVLKEPMGSRGTGVFFVRDADEIHSIIEEHRQRAVSEAGFLDNLIAQKGRIPSWVLQAEIKPCLLIRGRRKFHIRTYIVCLETNVLLDESVTDEEDDIMKAFIYNRHEIRIASKSVPLAGEEEPGQRSREAHITETFDRKLLQDEPELVARNLHAKVESFVANAIEAFRPDMERRIAMSASATDGENENSHGCMVLPHKFAIAGLDLMVTEDDTIYLLEANVNPAAPPPETVANEFQSHLIGFFRDTMELVTSRKENGRNNFYSTRSIIRR
mmetsp:Transcript_22753/g.53733  ORF Transcript_22753/g.53733 Transcript_22753/m.53733 type:complete len:510 (-) Transcript_22753:1424-2953(-)